MLGGSFPIAPFNKGATPMPKVNKLMVEEGTMATNFFIHTPIVRAAPPAAVSPAAALPCAGTSLTRRSPSPQCCPSRSEVLSGKYFHNIKTVGGGCMHVDEDKVNNATFAKYLTESAGYKVGM